MAVMEVVANWFEDKLARWLKMLLATALSSAQGVPWAPVPVWRPSAHVVTITVAVPVPFPESPAHAMPHAPAVTSSTDPAPSASPQ
jgi:hypothetical protein